MIAETIFVGTELILGNVINTNAAYLASELAKMGISTYYQSVVGDDEARIKSAVELALSRADIIFLSGGMGPTQDDITKETVAKTLGLELVEDKQARDNIITYFEKRGWVITDNIFKQAFMPKGCTVLYNDNGTAPGAYIEQNGKHIIMLPGPTVEMRAMYENSVVPILNKCNDGVIETLTVKVVGRSESEVAEILDDLISMKGNVTVTPCARDCEVHLYVTAKGTDETAAKKRIKPIVKEIKSRLEDSVYTTQTNVNLEDAVVELLLANKLTITTVESCTGGLVAGRLINVPGVSEVYKSGQITYSNQEKSRILGVKKLTLHKYGAVSEETVYEMCVGACSYNKADVSIAISGIAGPDGGTPEKPVGLVYIGCCVCGQVTVKEYHFSGNREKVRNSAVAESLALLRHCVLEYYSKLTFGGEQ